MDKTTTLKAQVEAVLFLTDRPVRAQAIARIINADVQQVRQALLELIHDYETRSGALEIAQDNGYIIQVKDQYGHIIDEFLPMEMSTAVLRTLSAIAIKQPVPQSEIIKIRGAGAYDHIRDLIERELVAKKDEGGRSPSLTTTRKFQEYFRLTGDARVLRQQVKRQEAAAKRAAGAEAGPGGDADGQDDRQVEAVQLPIPEISESVLDSAIDTIDVDSEAGSSKENDQIVSEMVPGTTSVSVTTTDSRHLVESATEDDVSGDQQPIVYPLGTASDTVR